MISENFRKALQIVLKHEGNFCDLKEDKGGATKYGISLRLLKSQGIDIDLDGHINVDDIKKLTPENAEEIYHRLWWEKYDYDKIKNFRIASRIFDLAVNMGAIQAHKLVQRAINSVSTQKVRIDGIFGIKTFNSINFIENAGGSETFYNAIIKNAGNFYSSLVKSNPSLKIFYKGWINRLND